MSAVGVTVGAETEKMLGELRETQICTWRGPPVPPDDSLARLTMQPSTCLADLRPGSVARYPYQYKTPSNNVRAALQKLMNGTCSVAAMMAQWPDGYPVRATACTLLDSGALTCMTGTDCPRAPQHSLQ
jgi:hypothetical protein